MAVGRGCGDLAAVRACSAASTSSSPARTARRRSSTWRVSSGVRSAEPSSSSASSGGSQVLAGVAEFELQRQDVTSGLESLAVGEQGLLGGLYGLAQLLPVCLAVRSGSWAAYPRLAYQRWTAAVVAESKTPVLGAPNPRRRSAA